jgi:hypothetical protein
MHTWHVPVTMALSPLIPYLMSSPTTSRIIRLEWYECRTPTEHNFVILEVGRVQANNLWLRIDRIGNTDEVRMRYLVLKLCLTIRYFTGADLRL